MVDYAITAVGRADQGERITSIASGNEVRNFEEIGSRTESSPWKTTDDFHNSSQIIQEPSSADGQLKKTTAPWNEVADRTVDRLDNIQQDWKHAERDLFSIDTSSKADMTTQEGLNGIKTMFRDLFKASYNMVNSQFSLTLVSSVASAFKTSITTLYRQQG